MGETRRDLMRLREGRKWKIDKYIIDVILFVSAAGALTTVLTQPNVLAQGVPTEIPSSQPSVLQPELQSSNPVSSEALRLQADQDKARINLHAQLQRNITDQKIATTNAVTAAVSKSQTAIPQCGTGIALGATGVTQEGATPALAIQFNIYSGPKCNTNDQYPKSKSSDIITSLNQTLKQEQDFMKVLLELQGPKIVSIEEKGVSKTVLINPDAEMKRVTGALILQSSIRIQSTQALIERTLE
jgi:hypothetical protein